MLPDLSYSVPDISLAMNTKHLTQQGTGASPDVRDALDLQEVQEHSQYGLPLQSGVSHSLLRTIPKPWKFVAISIYTLQKETKKSIWTHPEAFQGGVSSTARSNKRCHTNLVHISSRSSLGEPQSIFTTFTRQRT